MMVTVLFWLAICGILYAYFGYPLLLKLLAQFNAVSDAPTQQIPNGYSVTIIIPAHNEEAVIEQKLRNTLELDYPADKLEIIVVSDGSTDRTNQIVKSFHNISSLTLVEVNERKGKANALNQGLKKAAGDIIVFLDASMMLEKNALKMITECFSDQKIGCISGEDHIPGGESEGVYGRYELYLRNLESKTGSIVGASGSFYAQRRILCRPFVEGLAPDFLSVLNTVEQGYRAITEPRAHGMMGAVKNTKDELNRKVRTLLRGMATLWYKRNLLNPFHFGFFSFVLFSHKLMRWLVPCFLIVALISNVFLLKWKLYLGIFILQIVFYLLAYLAWREVKNIGNAIYGKIPLYFLVANLAILLAWVKFFRGVRQEIWDPSQRANQTK